MTSHIGHTLRILPVVAGLAITAMASSASLAVERIDFEFLPGDDSRLGTHDDLSAIPGDDIGEQFACHGVRVALSDGTTPTVATADGSDNRGIVAVNRLGDGRATTRGLRLTFDPPVSALTVEAANVDGPWTLRAYDGGQREIAFVTGFAPKGATTRARVATSGRYGWIHGALLVPTRKGGPEAPVVLFDAVEYEPIASVACGDDDHDGVANRDDLCPATPAADTAAAGGLDEGRWADLDGDGHFETRGATRESFDILDTEGCNCAQIIGRLGMNPADADRGCDTPTMQRWIRTSTGIGLAGVNR